MPDQNNGEFIPVGLTVDQASFASLEQRLNVMGDKLLILQRTNQAYADTVGKSADTIRNAYTKAGDAVSEFARRMEIARKSAQQGNWNDLRGELMGGGGGSGATTAGASGLRVEGLRRTGGALSQLGLGAIGEPVSRLGDVAQVAKEASAGLAALGASLGGMLAIAAPVAAGIALIALAIHNLQEQSKDARAALDSIIRTQDEYYKFIQTATTKQVQAQVEALDKETERYKQQQEENADIIRQFVTGPNYRSSSYTTEQLRQMSGADLIKMFDESITLNLDPTIKAAIDKFKELWPKISDDNVLMGRYNGLIRDNAQAANDAAEAEKKLRDARLSAIDQTISKEMEYIKLINSGTSKDITSQIRDKWNEIHQIETAMIGLENSTNEDDKKKYAELKKRRDDDAASIARLTNEVLPLVEAREKEAAAIKRTNDAAKTARETIAKQNETLASAYEKHADNVQSIIQNDLETRAAIEQKYQDTLVKAAEDAVEAATNALQKLEQQRQDLATGLSDDLAKSERDAKDKELDIAIKAQRQERDDLVSHLRRLQEIRNQNQAGEQQAIWDRNALELIRLRLSKTQQMEAENTAFAQKKSDQARQASDELSDLRRNDAIQRRERQIAYELANRDAQIQYQRELTLAAATKKKTIELAAAAAEKEIELEKKKVAALLKGEDERAKAEMKAALVTSDVRIKLLKAEADAARKMIGAIVDSATQSRAEEFRHGLVARAGGGDAFPGQLYQVNDARPGQRESFNGVPFPPGLGLFMPRQSGTIRSSSSAAYHIEVPITINDATDPIRVGNIVGPIVEGKIDHALHVVMGG